MQYRLAAIMIVALLSGGCAVRRQQPKVVVSIQPRPPVGPIETPTSPIKNPEPLEEPTIVPSPVPPSEPERPSRARDYADPKPVKHRRPKKRQTNPTTKTLNTPAPVPATKDAGLPTAPLIAIGLGIVVVCLLASAGTKK